MRSYQRKSHFSAFSSARSIPAARAAALATALFIATPAHGAPVVFSAAGSAADIQPDVDAFRTTLGANNGVGGTFSSGRREINWDGVPDASSAPNALAADFFNTTSPRGAVFSSTAGATFEVSADSSNPTLTSVRFGNLNASYSALFTTFSAERLFTPVGSTVTLVDFFVPGTTTRATVKGFGAVFADVDTAGDSLVEFFDANGTALAVVAAQPGDLSFVGVYFTGSEEVASVRLTSGNTIIGAADNPAGGADIVALDDFLYGEPRDTAPIAPAVTSPVSGTVQSTNPVTLTGTGEKGATVTILEGATTLGTTTVGTNGMWSFITPTLASGAHTFTTTLTSGALTSSASAPVTVTLDASGPPAAPVITTTLSGTTTIVPNPVITGTAPAWVTVEVLDGTTSLGFTGADSAGNWTFIPTAPLGAGEHVFYARAVDDDGNASDLSAPVTITIITELQAPQITSRGANVTVTMLDLGAGTYTIRAVPTRGRAKARIFTKTSNVADVKLPKGQRYRITYHFTSPLGVESEESASRTITVGGSSSKSGKNSRHK